MIHCLPTFLKNKTKDLQCKPTIGEKLLRHCPQTKKLWRTKHSISWDVRRLKSCTTMHEVLGGGKA